MNQFKDMLADTDALSAPDALRMLEDLSKVFFPAGSATIETPDGLLTHAVPGPAAAQSEAEIKYQTLVEQIPAVIFMASLDGSVGKTYVSPHIETALGFRQQEWINDPVRWYRQIHPDDQGRWSSEAAELFLSGTPLRSVYRVIARDGHTVWFHCQATMVRGADGQPLFIHGVGFDITDLKEAEGHKERLERAVAARTLELAEANARLTILDRSKNEFLNLISHELRTPLNGLLGVGQIVLDEMPATPENKELVQMFEQSRKRILSILDDALLLTHIDVSGESFRSAPVALHAVLRHAIEHTAEFAESRDVILGPPAFSPHIVLGNQELLERALHALLETSVKFSEAGETVRIAYEVVPDFVRVIIESNGRTIPDSALPKFFDLFAIAETSTPGGDLGLGPPVAYRILSLFGASVSVANRDQFGIRLTISLNNVALNR